MVEERDRADTGGTENTGTSGEETDLMEEGNTAETRERHRCTKGMSERTNRGEGTVFM